MSFQIHEVWHTISIAKSIWWRSHSGYFERGEILEIPKFFKNLLRKNVKSCKPNMVELQFCEHVETMYPNTQKFNNIFEEVNGRIAIFQENSLGKNIKKMCINFDWHMMMEKLLKSFTDLSCISVKPAETQKFNYYFRCRKCPKAKLSSKNC